jgi:hypothetical protein
VLERPAEKLLPLAGRHIKKNAATRGEGCSGLRSFRTVPGYNQLQDNSLADFNNNIIGDGVPHTGKHIAFFFLLVG